MIEKGHRKKGDKGEHIRPILVCVSIVVLVLALWKVPQYFDRLRFNGVERKQSGIASELVGSLGNSVAESEIRDVCFNAGQGPYDHGKLWCQTATVVKLRDDINQEETGAKFIEIAKSEGFIAHSTKNYGVPRYWFEVSGMNCLFTALSSKGDEISGAAYTTIRDSDAPAVAVSCAGRAKAKHYPFVAG